MPKRKSKKLWRIDYVVGNTYKFKLLYANTAAEAIKKSRIKDPVDVTIEREESVNQEDEDWD